MWLTVDNVTYTTLIYEIVTYTKQYQPHMPQSDMKVLLLRDSPCLKELWLCYKASNFIAV